MEEPVLEHDSVDKQVEPPENVGTEELHLLEKCKERLPFLPKKWQLDVTLKILKKQDVLLLSGTGSGKSLCFILPGLVTGKPTLVLSPLNVLEEDQAAAFRALGIRAIGLNARNCDKKTLKKIAQRSFEVVITSPELVMDSKKWRPLVASPQFSGLWGLVVVDEAHCMLQWGLPQGKRKAFRPAWAKIGDIRALIKNDIPWLAVTATLALEDLGSMRRLLNASSNLQIVNLGNDWPDIIMEYREMKHNMKSMRDLLDIVIPRPGEPLQTTMVFFDSRELAHQAQEKIHGQLQGRDKDKVCVYHAMRSLNAKKTVMKKFRNQDVQILLCTEAAGMGCDIPFVKKVVQWRIPSTLCMWLQRAGWAARSPMMKGHAILLGRRGFKEEIRKSRALKAATTLASSTQGQVQRKTKKKGKKAKGGQTEEHEVGIEDVDELACDKGLADWVMGGCCRRIIQDKYFGNTNRKPVDPSLCCDFCRDKVLPRPLTPIQDNADNNPDPASHHSQHSTVMEPDHNGKRKKGEMWRKDEDLKQVAAEILAWRDDIWEREYAGSYLPVDIIIDDETIQRVAKFMRLCHADELRKEWGGYEEFGGELLLLVERVDEKIASEKLAIQEAKKAEAAAAKAQQNRLKELTNTHTPQRPPTCRTPVFNVPGTGVFQVHVETPHTLGPSSSISSMTSVFSMATWDSEGTFVSPTSQNSLAASAFPAPAFPAPDAMIPPASIGAMQESPSVPRPRPRPCPVKKARLQEMDLANE